MKRLVMLAWILTGGLTALAAPPRVLLAPFESIGPNQATWISKALGQNLTAELSRGDAFTPVVAKESIADQPAALKAGQDVGAQFVIFGSYQAVETELRITGQVVEVATGRSVGVLKATGSQRDLFGLEDVIAHQARRALPQPPASEKPEMLRQPPAEPEAPAPLPPNNDQAQKARQLEEQIDRAIQRLRAAPAPDPDDTTFYSNYYRYGFGYPYVGYPIYYNTVYANRSYCAPGYGTHFSGSYRGNNWNVGFRVGAAVPDGRNYSRPTGNYAIHPGNYMRPQSSTHR